MNDASTDHGVTMPQTASVPHQSRPYRRILLWLGVVAFMVALPWLFYDWHGARQSGFLLSMLSQLGMMVIFALSYNMLMGQTGLLSFGHAALFGLAGYCTVHFLDAAGKGDFPVPMELIPLVAGFAGLGFGIVYGYIAATQRATAFAMITLGLGELTTVAGIMFHHFFGGEGGISTDRVIDQSLFGLSYASSIQVYYLIIAWVVIAALGMLFLTRTPLGAMANATRDNFERARFMGYNPRTVRFMQFALSGFFAGIGGGLYAITYEIVTYDAVNGALSANVVLMTYIGGATFFYGPILGAALITVLQSGLSLLSNAWLIYVGVLFIGMVTFAPTGLAGMIEAHGPIARVGRLNRLLVPYLRLSVPALATLIGFAGVVELTSFLTIGEAQGKSLVLFGTTIHARTFEPWLVTAVLLIGGGSWLRREIRIFGRVWDSLTADLKERSM